MKGNSVGGAQLIEEIGKGEVVCVCEIHSWREIGRERKESVGYPGHKIKNPSDRAGESVDDLWNIFSS